MGSILIDGELTNINRVNYLLRGINVPKGKHDIELKFNPKVVYRGQIISLWAFVVFLLLILCGLALRLRKLGKVNKRVLIICPTIGHLQEDGVQRWVKFIKYLPNFGIEPVVLIPENPSYPFQDNTLINEINPDLSLFKLPIKEPYKLANIFGEKSKRLSSGIINPSNKQSLIERLLLFIKDNFFYTRR